MDKTYFEIVLKKKRKTRKVEANTLENAKKIAELQQTNEWKVVNIQTCIAFDERLNKTI